MTTETHAATTPVAAWVDQLASLAALAPGWVTWDDDGPWGLPPDEGAIATARRFLTSLGDVVALHPPRCSADPETGDVSIHWRIGTLPQRCVGVNNLSAYIEAGVVCQILAYTADMPVNEWDINREDVPFAKAVAIVRDWLAPRPDYTGMAESWAAAYLACNVAAWRERERQKEGKRG